MERFGTSRLSWGGTFAGAFSALALLNLLLFLGAAVGLTVADASGWPAALGGAGLMTAIFVALASFFGAHLGVQLSDLRGKAEAALQGFVTWAVSFEAMAVFVAILGALGVGVVEAPSPEAAAEAGRTAAWWLFLSALFGAAGGLIGGAAAFVPKEGATQRPEGIVVPPGREVTP